VEERADGHICGSARASRDSEALAWGGWGGGAATANHRPRADPRSPAYSQRAAFISCVTSQGPSDRITDHGTGFREVSMEQQAYTPAVERPASPIVSAPVATRLDAPLIEIMFHLLGGRDRWRRLPILRSLTRRLPSGV
jgi:hypothetical protein